MADWSEDVEATLVEMWANSPCLYDTTSKSYASRTAKRKAYEEIQFMTRMTGKFLYSLQSTHVRLIRCALTFYIFANDIPLASRML